MSATDSGLVLCTMCKASIREVPGKPGMIFYDICDACKTGQTPPAPPVIMPGPVIPSPVTCVPPQSSAASPSTTDLVIKETANILADKLIALFIKTLAADAQKEKDSG